MELPHLGKQCSLEKCLEKNDFLILKCSFCKLQFCNPHSKPRESQAAADNQGGHFCNLYPIDARTYPCPACSQIVPVARGEDPNVVINQHISEGCRRITEKKAYTNQCGKKGCSKKELVPMQCKICLINFCIKHRLETDHDCIGPPPPKAANIWHLGRSSAAGKNNSTTQKNKINECILQ